MPHEQIAAECGDCGKQVSAQVIASLERVFEEATFTVTLTECPYCQAAIVLGHSTDLWGDMREGEFTVHPPQRLWPSPARELSVEAPEGIRNDFDQAQRCMSAGSPLGAALVARRLLESIAVDQGATGSTLAGKLKSLKVSGAIDGRLAEWADALRVVGNDAAHNFTSSISPEDAADALSFAEAMADYVYTFRARYDRFMARRKNPGQP